VRRCSREKVFLGTIGSIFKVVAAQKKNWWGVKKHDGEAVEHYIEKW